MSGQGLRTGELAALAGVNIQTLRYYERRGLRAYPEGAVRLVRTIKAAQRLGFSLTEIQELFALSEHRRGPDALRRRASAKVTEIEARIEQLQRVREALLAVMAADCDSLTDCSCGQGCPLPDLEVPAPGAGPVGRP